MPITSVSQKLKHFPTKLCAKCDLPAQAAPTRTSEQSNSEESLFASVTNVKPYGQWQCFVITSCSINLEVPNSPRDESSSNMRPLKMNCAQYLGKACRQCTAKRWRSSFIVVEELTTNSPARSPLIRAIETCTYFQGVTCGKTAPMSFCTS